MAMLTLGAVQFAPLIFFSVDVHSHTTALLCVDIHSFIGWYESPWGTFAWVTFAPFVSVDIHLFTESPCVDTHSHTESLCVDIHSFNGRCESPWVTFASLFETRVKAFRTRHRC
jgi:hypothetical protein